MEKASEGFTREQRKAHGIRFGASPSRHRGGRAWLDQLRQPRAARSRRPFVPGASGQGAAENFERTARRGLRPAVRPARRASLHPSARREVVACESGGVDDGVRGSCPRLKGPRAVPGIHRPSPIPPFSLRVRRGRRSGTRRVGTPGAPVSAHSLTVLHVRADNMRIADAASSPGSRQIRYSLSPAHGLRLLRRSGYVKLRKT